MSNTNDKLPEYPRSLDWMVRHCADLIQKEVGYFNGWSVSQDTEREACEIAAKKVERYLRRKLTDMPKTASEPNVTDEAEETTGDKL